MANGGEARAGGLGTRLRRLLGTDQLIRQNKLLRDQNEYLKAHSREMSQLVKAAAAQHKATSTVGDLIRKETDQLKTLRADLLAAQKEAALLEKKILEVQNQQRARLDQLSYALFELNRRTYAEGESERFDIGSAAAAYFSQNGEDGIVQEIARRLQIQVETFIEIGAGDGATNNSVYLLLGGARGIWVEIDSSAVAKIHKQHQAAVEDGRLTVVKARVTAENVDQLLREADAPGEVDFLSIDIDGNDYWVWQALSVVSAKILCLEYNAFHGPDVAWVKAYDPEFSWPGGDIYYGASLKALEQLSRQKGYALVACDYSGTNAFFVREDLLNDAFKGPFTAAQLYQPNRGRLGSWPPPKRVVFGPHEIV